MFIQTALSPDWAHFGSIILYYYTTDIDAYALSAEIFCAVSVATITSFLYLFRKRAK
jgi:hypothetical protein